MTDDLQHYGIKGMKWGVRKADPYASTESRQLRKESKKNVRRYMVKAFANEPLFNWMSQDEYDKLSTKGETIAKGTIVRRISKEETRKVEGAAFVSKLLADSDYYRAAIPAYDDAVKSPGGGKKKYALTPYEIEMTTVNKLSLPSEKVRVDTFKEILATPAIRVPNQTAPITGRQYLENMGYKFKNTSDHDFALMRYRQTFTTDQGNQDNPLNKVYFDALKKKGYNALLDDNDAGKVTKSPYIILDAEKNVKINSVRRLTADEINQAQRRLVPKD